MLENRKMEIPKPRFTNKCPVYMYDGVVFDPKGAKENPRGIQREREPKGTKENPRGPEGNHKGASRNSQGTEGKPRERHNIKWERPQH